MVISIDFKFQWKNWWLFLILLNSSLQNWLSKLILMSLNVSSAIKVINNKFTHSLWTNKWLTDNSVNGLKHVMQHRCHFTWFSSKVLTCQLIILTTLLALSSLAINTYEWSIFFYYLVLTPSPRVCANTPQRKFLRSVPFIGDRYIKVWHQRWVDLAMLRDKSGHYSRRINEIISKNVLYIYF